MRRSGRAGRTVAVVGVQEEEEHRPLEAPQRLGHFPRAVGRAAKPLERDPLTGDERRGLDDMPELAELGRIPGVLGRVVRKGDEQTLVEPGQPAEIAMVQIRGGNLRHPAHQRVVPEQPSQWRQRVFRAGDLRQRVGRFVEGNGGNLRERQRIEVEELNAADREAESGGVRGWFRAAIQPQPPRGRDALRRSSEATVGRGASSGFRRGTGGCPARRGRRP